ncbi:glycosyltransferase family 2 protein [Patescibacteria group bacterium]|nr:glycosyltransferase family 2 protein [Patescibacteria group bacterium]
MRLYLSIVIPAYNEEENIRKSVLDKVWKYLSRQKYSWEVLVVDDGSTDKTADLAEKFAKEHKDFRVMREPHRGKGGTVIAGMLAAKGEVVLFTDMDQATPINQIEKLLPKFSEKYDIAIGSRSGREGAPLVRKIMAYGFMLLRTLVLRLPYKDTQCGFKAFKRSSAKKIFKKMKIFSEKGRARGASVSAGFDLEILYIARKLGLKVAEVPVSWRHQEGTKVNPIKDSWEGFRDLVRVRLNALLGLYR